MLKKVTLCLTFLILALVVSSGAFSSITAERPVEVNVADDSNALLSLSATGSYTSYKDGMIAIELPNGANIEAETDFGKVFTITNNGTNNVSVTIHQYLNGEDVTLTSPLLFSKSASSTPQHMDAVWDADLAVGATMEVYMKIYTNMEQYPSEIGTIIDSIQIVAK